MWPTRSPVLALTFTSPTASPSRPARLARIGRLDGAEFRLLGEDDHVEIDHAPAVAVQARERFTEEEGGVGAAQRGSVVGVGVADVAEAGGAEQGVGDGVQHDVGVAVAGEAARMLDADAAEQERPAGFEPVGVVSDADAHGDGTPNRGGRSRRDGL